MAPKTMTDEHKKALAEGRKRGAAVKAYLDALEAHKPKRGRKRTKESIEKKLAEIEATIDDAEQLQKLSMIQQRSDLLAEIVAMEEAGAGPDIAKLQADFVKHAAAYGESKGISYSSWREIGVAPAVLKEAGIKRGS